MLLGDRGKLSRPDGALELLEASLLERRLFLFPALHAQHRLHLVRQRLLPPPFLLHLDPLRHPPFHPFAHASLERETFVLVLVLVVGRAAKRFNLLEPLGASLVPRRSKHLLHILEPLVDALVHEVGVHRHARSRVFLQELLRRLVLRLGHVADGAKLPLELVHHVHLQRSRERAQLLLQLIRLRRRLVRVPAALLRRLVRVRHRLEQLGVLGTWHGMHHRGRRGGFEHAETRWKLVEDPEPKRQAMNLELLRSLAPRRDAEHHETHR